MEQKEEINSQPEENEETRIQKKNGPNERTDKVPKKIQLSNEEITNLSDAQFKTLVIRMLTKMVEYGCKMEEKVKAMQSEMKRNVQGTNSKGKEIWTLHQQFGSEG